MKPPFWDRATRTLAERDHILRRLIATFPDIHLVRRGDAFTTLARAIVGQQISVKAAQTIWNRYAEACGAGSDAGALGVRLEPARVARMRLQQASSQGSVTKFLASVFPSARANTSAISPGISSRESSIL